MIKAFLTKWVLGSPKSNPLEIGQTSKQRHCVTLVNDKGEQLCINENSKGDFSLIFNNPDNRGSEMFEVYGEKSISFFSR